MLLLLLRHFSHVRLRVALWTVAHQAPLSMGFSRQEYWGGLPCPPPGDLPNPGIEPGSPALQADSLPLRYQWSPKSNIQYKISIDFVFITVFSSDFSGRYSWCFLYPSSSPKKSVSAHKNQNQTSQEKGEIIFIL